MTGRSHLNIGLGRCTAAFVPLIAILVLLAPGLALAADSTVDIKVANSESHYVPSTITVAVGDTVTWENSSPAPHTVTSDEAGGPMNSNEFNEGQSSRAPFDTAGDFAYHCTLHSFMHGIVHVEAAAAQETRPPGLLPHTDVFPPPDSMPVIEPTALLGLLGVGTFLGILLMGSR